MGRNNSAEWIGVQVKAETKKAWLFSDGVRECWVAKSQIMDSEDEIKVGTETRVELPVWLIEESGLA